MMLDITESDLETLGVQVKEVKAHLPSQPACDAKEWVDTWSMLVGAWFSLHMAYPGADDIRPSSDDKLAFADQLPSPQGVLPGRLIDLRCNTSPWHTGYFLINAEHRICNSLDRVMKIFSWRPRENVFALCEKVTKNCVHGCGATPGAGYLNNCAELLRSFGREDHDDISLRIVWRRVNSLKHKVGGHEYSLKERLSMVYQALRTVTIVYQDLADHRSNCSSIAEKLKRGKLPPWCKVTGGA